MLIYSITQLGQKDLQMVLAMQTKDVYVAMLLTHIKEFSLKTDMNYTLMNKKIFLQAVGADVP